ncbi:aminotransferase, classes I and II family protein [Tritrichomonas foetus]|uniref:Aspartate aminotransferase n=1 Tax=Tritrichomonas foetus TaxID=1144522 RepID=A0A1J4KUQ8_9EUKA|nr:aminotransferase, classes I and II family protein [Tritrichomonas foetus]|eukprot:OHT14874.1 aminotransferase, classes I and II family protein [Tritrichomonas foetus]
MKSISKLISTFFTSFYNFHFILDNRSKMLSDRLSNVEHAPPDAIFGVSQKFNASPLKEKYLLSVGVYRTEESQPHVFSAVREAESRIHHKYSKDYLPMTGCPTFLRAARQLLFTNELLDKYGDRIGSVQSCAGTGALYLCSRFAKKFLNNPKVLLSNPMWPNYRLIFGDNGHEIGLYPWLKQDCTLDIDGFCEALEKAPRNCLVVIQVCAHNPTGVDPTPDQWQIIYRVAKECGHLLCFDFAYMGFASGDINVDAQPVRDYLEWGIPFLCCFSFSKCMGLYGERIGVCHAFCSSKTDAENVRSQIALLGRETWSVCPQNGSYIAAEVLQDEELHRKWIEELQCISGRIRNIRAKLCDLLEEKTGRSWEFLRKQRGMFAHTGLTPEQVDKLADQGVFIPRSGRVSIPALNNNNVEFIANAIAAAVAD